MLYGVPEVFFFFVEEERLHAGCFQLNTNLSTSYPFSAGYIMSDRVSAPCTFSCSQRKKKDISKFSFSTGSSFPKLLNLRVETQSRDPAARGTEDHWDYEEAAVP